MIGQYEIKLCKLKKKREKDQLSKSHILQLCWIMRMILGTESFSLSQWSESRNSHPGLGSWQFCLVSVSCLLTGNFLVTLASSLLNTFNPGTLFQLFTYFLLKSYRCWLLNYVKNGRICVARIEGEGSTLLLGQKPVILEFLGQPLKKNKGNNQRKGEHLRTKVNHRYIYLTKM